LSQYEKSFVNLICANTASTSLNKEDTLKLTVLLLAHTKEKEKETREIVMLRYTGSSRNDAVITVKLTHLTSQNMQQSAV
jgi:hypothetical protein